MTTRVFPLRARLPALQRFIDRYLNIVPEEVGRFRAFVPYVHLMLLDYGTIAEDASNLGWFAQREILFSIPVEHHRVVDGRWQFEEWGVVTPFIWVDSSSSVALGRTAIGWPKSSFSMTPTVSEWLRDVHAPERAATFSTMVFPAIYSGARQERRVFLEVVRRSSATPFQAPLDPGNAFMPWNIVGHSVSSVLGLARDAMATAMGLANRPASLGDPERAHVYLVVTRFGDVASPTNNVGAWASQELSFFIPLAMGSRSSSDRSIGTGRETTASALRSRSTCWARARSRPGTTRGRARSTRRQSPSSVSRATSSRRVSSRSTWPSVTCTRATGPAPQRRLRAPSS